MAECKVECLVCVCVCVCLCALPFNRVFQRFTLLVKFQNSGGGWRSVCQTEMSGNCLVVIEAQDIHPE